MSAPLPVLAPAGKPAVEPAVLSRFLDAPIDAVQVGTIDHKLAHVMKADTDRVLLSAATMTKQAARHPDIERAVYEAIEPVLAKPDLVLEETGDRKIWLFGVVAGGVLRIVLKGTADGEEVYIVSVHKVAVQALRKMLRSTKLLQGEAKTLLAVLEGKRVR
jgi:hypothetical protein